MNQGKCRSQDLDRAVLSPPPPSFQSREALQNFDEIRASQLPDRDRA